METAGRARRGGIDGFSHFLGCDSTVGANHTCRDAEGSSTKYVAGNDIPDAENEDDNTGRDDDLPARKSERLLAGGLLVQITKDRDTDDDHEDTEGDEAGGFAEQGPIP